MPRVIIFALAVIAAVVCTARVGAQASLGTATAPGISFQVPPSPPPTPVPAPPISHPGHRDHVQPMSPGGDLFLADPHTYAPRFNRRPARRLHPSVAPYAVGPFPYFGLPAYAVPHEHDPSHGSGREASAPGYLRLDIAPAAAQVYVDGFFVGSPDDVMRVLPLREGTHHIEVKADGFETTAFDVLVRSNETVRFSGSMVRLNAGSGVVRLTPDSTTLASRPAVAKTLYVIPRCYAGDRLPVASQLPVGCRVADVRAIAPQGR
jgi:hypothetical protein